MAKTEEKVAAKEKAPAASGFDDMQPADLVLVGETVQRHPGMSNADAWDVICRLRELPYDEHLKTKDGEWTWDGSQRPVLHPKVVAPKPEGE